MICAWSLWPLTLLQRCLFLLWIIWERIVETEDPQMLYIYKWSRWETESTSYTLWGVNLERCCWYRRVCTFRGRHHQAAWWDIWRLFWKFDLYQGWRIGISVNILRFFSFIFIVLYKLILVFIIASSPSVGQLGSHNMQMWLWECPIYL